MARNPWHNLFILPALIFLAACGPSPTPTVTPSSLPTQALTPYLTVTPSPTVVFESTGTQVPIPSLTPTPRTHTVVKGEDLGGIAYRYGVTLAALMEANPTVKPNLLSIGTVLIIPPPNAKTASTGLPSPTPVSVGLSPVTCSRNQEGGAWCFVIVTNTQEGIVENVLVRISLQSGETRLDQTAVSPLNLIPIGGTMPMEAYFPPPLPLSFQGSASLVNALPLNVNDQRYLPVKLQNIRTKIMTSGLAAEISAEIVPPEGNAHTSQVWVVLAAFDSSGQVVGLRRWEGAGDLSLTEPLVFSDYVYSTGSKITTVSTWVEARP